MTIEQIIKIQKQAQSMIPSVDLYREHDSLFNYPFPGYQPDDIP